jgi:hypothetical protein
MMGMDRRVQYRELTAIVAGCGDSGLISAGRSMSCLADGDVPRDSYKQARLLGNDYATSAAAVPC